MAQYSDQQILSFIVSNLSDPRTVRNAMQQTGVTASDVARAVQPLKDAFNSQGLDEGNQWQGGDIGQGDAATNPRNVIDAIHYYGYDVDPTNPNAVGAWLSVRHSQSAKETQQALAELWGGADKVPQTQAYHQAVDQAWQANENRMRASDASFNRDARIAAMIVAGGAMGGFNALGGALDSAVGTVGLEASAGSAGTLAGTEALTTATGSAGADTLAATTVAQQAASAGIPWKEIGQNLVQIGKYILPAAQAALAVQALTSGDTSTAQKILATAALVDSTGRIINQVTANTPITNTSTQGNTQSQPITNNQLQLPGGNSNMESLGQSFSQYGIDVAPDGSMTKDGQPVSVDDNGNAYYTDSNQPVMYDDGSGVSVPLNTSNVNTINNQVQTDSNGNIITPSNTTNTTGNQSTTGNGKYPTLPDGTIDWAKLAGSLATGAAQYEAFNKTGPYDGGASKYMTNAGYVPGLNSVENGNNIEQYAGFKPGGIGPMPTDLYNTYKNFLQNPADMEKNPMFSAFNTQQQQATERALQARGMNSSGNMVQQLGQNAMANWATYYPQLANTLEGGATTEANRWNTANTANLNAGQLGTSMFNTLTNANNQAGKLGLDQYTTEAQSQLARGAVAAQIAGGTVNSAASAFDPAQQAVSKYLTNYFANLGKTN